MNDLDWSKASRQQKLAIFLVCIGPEAAANILKHFDEVEIEGLCREMSAIAMVPEAMQKQALEEFAGIVAQSHKSALGGLGYAQRTLEIAKGDYKASSIMGRVGPTGTSVEVIREISEMEGRQIFNLIKNEQPQTISFVLSYLEGRQGRRGLRAARTRPARGGHRAAGHDRIHLARPGRQDRAESRQAFRQQGAARLPSQRRRARRGGPAEPAGKGHEQDAARAPGGAKRARSAPPFARSCSASRTWAGSSRRTCSACCARWTRRAWRSR